jgi:membrane carboxypeptidase/penicillin-binding protein
MYALLAGGVAVIAAIAAVIVVVIHGGTSTQTTGFLPSSSSSDSDAQQTATAFLQAWQSGDMQQAANYTSDPVAAKAALETYKKYLNLKKLSLSVDTAGTTGAITFAATATVATSDSSKAISGAWSYHGSFNVYQEKNGNYWYVTWAPDDLAPNLTSTTRLAAVSVSPTVVSVNDSSGNSLTSYGDVGLKDIARILEGSAPSGGTDGLYVEIQTNKGVAVANSQAVVVAPSNVASVATTISSSAETAAMNAVSQHTNSSMVVIQPTTGKILAIANHNASSDEFVDNALEAGVAPGSTMKTITSTALFNKGLATANSDVACPPTYTVQGITYHDDNNESLPASTPLYDDYAQSCNNAFDQWWNQLGGTSGNSQLASTAKDYYGLDQSWDIGIGESAKYMNVPTNASGSELAQELFGEGELTASPLAMASVAATVYNGQFEQPYIASGATHVTAEALPSSTDSQLKEMMRAVVTEGTAAGMGFSDTVYAKTGTADIVGQDQPNSWFIAFDTSKDVAIACLVLDAGYGAQFAAPEVKSFLDSY